MGHSKWPVTHVVHNPTWPKTHVIRDPWVIDKLQLNIFDIFSKPFAHVKANDASAFLKFWWPIAIATSAAENS